MDPGRPSPTPRSVRGVDGPEDIVSAAELEAMTPQQRAELIGAAIVTEWTQVPESFRVRVNERARTLGEQRRTGR